MVNKVLENLESHYKVEKEIGRGGMGAVYLATDTRLDRKVAIKILSIDSQNLDEDTKKEVVERFQREAKAIAKLLHPNIVGIYDIGQVDGQYYMVMEYLEGKSLAAILESKSYLPPVLVVSIATQVCNALSYAHENNIIHRDIKPDNIILSKKGIVKLTDFGIAQLNSDNQYKLTQAGSVLGSIMYISPEQLQNPAEVDHRTDLYSLGITMYELLTGELPFGGDSISQIFMQILSELPKKVSSLNSEVPEILDLIIEKSIAKSPNDRFQDAIEMGKSLSQLIDQDSLSSTSMNNIFSTNNTIAGIPSEFAQTVIMGKKDSDFTNPSEFSVTNTTLRKTNIDKTIIKLLQKNNLWIQTLIENWKTESVTRLNINQVIEKVMEPSLYGKAFTGALVVNKSLIAFVHDGYFVGAVDINTNEVGEIVFHKMYEDPESIELKIPEEEQFASPIIISSLLNNSGEPIHQNMDSSLVNLTPLIDSLSSEEESFTGYLTCYSETNIFYYGYYNGKQIFSGSAKKEDKSIERDTYSSLGNIISHPGIVLNSYSLNTVLMGPTVSNLLKNSNVLLKYHDNNKEKLYDLVDHGNEELPIHIIKEVKNNTYLELNLNQQKKLKLMDKEIDLENVVKNSNYYRFSNWVFNEYFYLLDSSGNSNSLKYIYSWIPATESIKFFEVLEGDDGNKYEFSFVTHGQVKGENYKKVLMLVRFGNGSKDDLEKYIEESITVKKKLIKSGDIGGAVYVSTQEYSSDALKLFYERTVEPRKGFGLGSLDKLTKYKGFVRIGFGRGFHLNLIEHRMEDNSFHVIAPLLK